MLRNAAIYGVICAGLYASFVFFDLPPFNDPRQGYPGIPSALGYAWGTKKNVLIGGSILYGIYGAGAGLLMYILINLKRF